MGFELNWGNTMDVDRVWIANGVGGFLLGVSDIGVCMVNDEF